MKEQIIYRKANSTDVIKLSILFKQVYIQTYGTEGVSDEFANFIFKQFSVERLSSLISTNPDAILVAAYNNNLVGAVEIDYSSICPINNIVAPELNKLYILEWFCGKGIGYHLLKEVENLVKSKGINEMWLWVLDSNERAISFYERQNYKWIGDASFQMEVNKYENKLMHKHL